MINEKEICGCGHDDKEHFALGCMRCDCVHFMSWEEIDKEIMGSGITHRDETEYQAKSVFILAKK